MKAFIYKVFAWAARYMGVWIVSAFAWIVSTGYFLFLPRRTAHSVRFYRTLFPDRGFWGHLGLAWKQYHDFAAQYADRLRLKYSPEKIVYTTEGWSFLKEIMDSGRGAILLMSHVGSWETAARLLSRQKAKLLLLMGARSGEQIEALQKSDLKQDGVEILAADPDDESSFSVLDMLDFIKKGGIISMAGDRAYTGDHRSIEVNFCGRKVSVLSAPHAFALITKTPIITFFALRIGRGRFHFIALKPRYVKTESRKDKAKVLQASAQVYADDLAKIVSRYPGQWHHFEPFV